MEIAASWGAMKVSSGTGLSLSPTGYGKTGCSVPHARGEGSDVPLILKMRALVLWTRATSKQQSPGSHWALEPGDPPTISRSAGQKAGLQLLGPDGRGGKGEARQLNPTNIRENITRHVTTHKSTKHVSQRQKIRTWTLGNPRHEPPTSGEHPGFRRAQGPGHNWVPE